MSSNQSNQYMMLGPATNNLFMVDPDGLRRMVAELYKDKLDLHARLQLSQCEVDAMQEKIELLKAELAAKDHEKDFYQTKAIYLQHCYSDAREQKDVLEKQLLSKKSEEKDDSSVKPPSAVAVLLAESSPAEPSRPILAAANQEAQSESSSPPVMSIEQQSNTVSPVSSYPDSPSSSKDAPTPTEVPQEAVPSVDNEVVIGEESPRKSPPPPAHESSQMLVSPSTADDDIEIIEQPAEEEAQSGKTFEQVCAEWSNDGERPRNLDEQYMSSFFFNRNGPKEVPQPVKKIHNSVCIFKEWRNDFGEQTFNQIKKHKEAWTILDKEQRHEWKLKYWAASEEQKKQLQNGWIAFKPTEKRCRKTDGGCAAKRIKLEPIDEY